MRATAAAAPARRPVPYPLVATIVALTALIVTIVPLVAVTLFVDQRSALTTAAGPVPYPVVLLGAAGLMTTSVAGLVLRTEAPQVTLGLGVAVLAVALPTWAVLTGLPVGLRVEVLAAAYLAAPALAQAVSSRSASCVRLAYGFGAAAVSVHVLTYNRFEDVTCSTFCRDVPAPLAGVVGARTGLQVSLLLSVVAAGLALSLVRSHGHPGLDVARFLAAAVVVGLCASDVVELVRVAGSVPAGSPHAWAPLGVGAVGAAVAWSVVRTERTRRALDRLLRHLEEPSGGARGPGATVHFAVPDESRWVDMDGRDVPATPTGPTLVVADGAGPALRLVLAPGASPDALPSRLTPARRLALGNARLTALAQARLRDVRAAQLRSVQRSDEEQRRIERDLHDGAQQSLVGAAFQLSLAGRRVPTGGTGLGRTQEAVSAALERLRRLSRGVVPPVLAEEGLTAALDELVRSSDVPARLTVHGDDASRPEVAVAVYLAVEAALGQARDGDTEVVVGLGPKATTVDVAVEWPDEASPFVVADDLCDRVRALGGTLEIAVRDRGAHLRTVIPCGS